VDVRIDEARDEELPPGVDDLGTVRHAANRVGRANGSDAVARDRHGLCLGTPRITGPDPRVHNRERDC